jgi:hypothetical protein
MSSHREAPGISKDPVADSTDLYAFVSNDVPGMVTIIANYIPLEAPAGGPNFYEFGDDVFYDINIDHTGHGEASIIYRFTFQSVITNTQTFLYNTGPIHSLTDPNWVRRQTYNVTRYVAGEEPETLGTYLASPPCNIGPRSTPNYPSLSASAINVFATGEKIFCGQRADAFFVDLGSIFDLGALRPLQAHHLIPMAAAAGVDTLKGANVHTIAIQLPFGRISQGGVVPTDPMSPTSVVGIWTRASRSAVSIASPEGGQVGVGPLVQVSRLGNPLFNEVIVPLASKDAWNQSLPRDDANFASYVAQPELAGLLPVLYPGAFPNLAAYTKPRADLEAVLLTGIPSGIVPGFQNYTGPHQADMLRLNLAIPATNSPNPMGLLGGDAAGYPNGRRVTDDVVAIELQAVAGATLPLVDPSFTPDAVVKSVSDGTSQPPQTYMDTFPYLGTPYDGFNNPSA